MSNDGRNAPGLIGLEIPATGSQENFGRQAYRSLSAAALAITGGAVNGSLVWMVG